MCFGRNSIFAISHSAHGFVMAVKFLLSQVPYFQYSNFLVCCSYLVSRLSHPSRCCLKLRLAVYKINCIAMMGLYHPQRAEFLHVKAWIQWRIFEEQVIWQVIAKHSSTRRPNQFKSLCSLEMRFSAVSEAVKCNQKPCLNFQQFHWHHYTSIHDIEDSVRDDGAGL